MYFFHKTLLEAHLRHKLGFYECYHLKILETACNYASIIQLSLLLFSKLLKHFKPVFLYNYNITGDVVCPSVLPEIRYLELSNIVPSWG